MAAFFLCPHVVRGKRKQRARGNWSVIRYSFYWIRSSHLWPHLSIITPLENISSNRIMWGYALWIHYMNFEAHNLTHSKDYKETETKVMKLNILKAWNAWLSLLILILISETNGMVPRYFLRLEYASSLSHFPGSVTKVGTMDMILPCSYCSNTSREHHPILFQLDHRSLLIIPFAQ